MKMLFSFYPSPERASERRRTKTLPPRSPRHIAISTHFPHEMFLCSRAIYLFMFGHCCLWFHLNALNEKLCSRSFLLGFYRLSFERVRYVVSVPFRFSSAEGNVMDFLSFTRGILNALHWRLLGLFLCVSFPPIRLGFSRFCLFFINFPDFEWRVKGFARRIFGRFPCALT